MAQEKVVPAVGEDVTHLMPAIGDDVTALMEAPRTAPEPMRPMAAHGPQDRMEPDALRRMPSGPWTPENFGAHMEQMRQNELERTDIGPLDDALRGAEQGLERSIVGAGEAAYRYLPGVRAVSDAVNAQSAIQGNRNDFAAAREALQPRNQAEQAGQTVEQIAEFLLLPSGKGNLLRRMGQESVEAGGLSMMQGGDPLAGAATGAAGPVVGRGAHMLRQQPLVQRAAGAIREGAEKRVTQALGATKERFKAMSETLAPEMLRRGVPGRLGASREGLLEQAKARATEFGRAVDSAIGKAKDDVVGVAPIVDALEEAKAGFAVPQRITAQEAMQRGLTERARDLGDGMVELSVVLDARPIRQLEQLQATLRELGDSATVEQIVAVRRVWDDVVARAGGFSHRRSGAFGVPLAEQTEAWAKREATKAIRRVLAESQPDIAALNKEFAFYAKLRDVLTATEKRTQAQSGGLGRTILGGAGATVGALSAEDTSDRVQNALIGGVAGQQLLRAVTSPRWRFVSAHLRNRLADAIASGQEGAITAALGRVTAAMTGGGALRPLPSH